MKKIISILLVTLFMSFSLSAGAAIRNDLLSESDLMINNVTALAQGYLSSIRESDDFCIEALGFNREEFLNMNVERPFKVYCLADNGDVSSNNIYSCPLFFNDSIVGLINIWWDKETGEPLYSFGRDYADRLNYICLSNVDVADGVAIFKYDDGLFATDGKSIFTILAHHEGTEETISEKVVKDTICTVFSRADLKLFLPTNRIEYYENRESICRGPIDPYGTNPLNVPIVLQGNGICGCAAWASVLNYRFNTSYTPASLLNKMNEYNYNSSSGIPTMTHYKNFANTLYNAGCITSFSLSYTNLTNAILNLRPIMGSWYTGSPGNYSWHAVLIIGYIKHNASTYTYYLWNPWYSYYSTITVNSSSNVQYTFGGSTWTLNSVVY